eukprot:scaffold263057_cov32-Tisochrysis_lutea.AAC.1
MATCRSRSCPRCLASGGLSTSATVSATSTQAARARASTSGRLILREARMCGSIARIAALQA